MIQIGQHKWSLASIMVTFANFVVTFGVVQYLYRRGAWHPNSVLGWMVEQDGAIGALLSFIVAIVAVVREQSRSYGLAALCLSIFSFFLYVR